MLVEHSVGSNTKNGSTPPMAVHSQHVAAKALWWWEGWEHWIAFMTSLYMYYVLCFVQVKHSVYHEPISGLINIIYIYIYISNLCIWVHNVGKYIPIYIHIYLYIYIYIYMCCIDMLYVYIYIYIYIYICFIYVICVIYMLCICN